MVEVSPATIARWEIGSRRGEGGPAYRYERIMEEIGASLVARMDIVALYARQRDDTDEQQGAFEAEMKRRLRHHHDIAPWYWPAFNMTETDTGVK